MAMSSFDLVKGTRFSGLERLDDVKLRYLHPAENGVTFVMGPDYVFFHWARFVFELVESLAAYRPSTSLIPLRVVCIGYAQRRDASPPRTSRIALGARIVVLAQLRRPLSMDGWPPLPPITRNRWGGDACDLCIDRKRALTCRHKDFDASFLRYKANEWIRPQWRLPSVFAATGYYVCDSHGSGRFWWW